MFVWMRFPEGGGSASFRMGMCRPQADEDAPARRAVGFRLKRAQAIERMARPFVSAISFPRCGSALESRLLCGSIGMFFVCLMPVIRSSRNVLAAVLSKCLAFVLRLSCVPVEMSCVRFTPAVCRLCQTGRLAICSCVPVPPWVVIVGSAFSNRRCGYPTFLVHFGLARSFMAIPTENEGTGERGERRERRTESARGRVRFCVTALALRCFRRGVRWADVEAALRPPPNLRQGVLVSLDSLHLIRGVGRFTRRRGLRRSEDLTGLRSFCACHAFLSKCLAFDHACCLPPVRQTGRLAICSVPVPPWVVIAGSAFSNRWCGYRISWVHFGLARFFMAIPTENEREHGERSRRRGVSALLREHIGFVVFSAGSPLGARAQPAPKSHWLSGLSSFGS